mmetsp:Transcript_4712/g.13636  ORF Transcript_4712/g.13636 Transcript_4712/m.13636 type:complete len:253 (-) Transcript_4712:169-927(-)
MVRTFASTSWQKDPTVIPVVAPNPAMAPRRMATGAATQTPNMRTATQPRMYRLCWRTRLTTTRTPTKMTTNTATPKQQQTARNHRLARGLTSAGTNSQSRRNVDWLLSKARSASVAFPKSRRAIAMSRSSPPPVPRRTSWSPPFERTAISDDALASSAACDACSTVRPNACMLETNASRLKKIAAMTAPSSKQKAATKKRNRFVDTRWARGLQQQSDRSTMTAADKRPSLQASGVTKAKAKKNSGDRKAGDA